MPSTTTATPGAPVKKKVLIIRSMRATKDLTLSFLDVQIEPRAREMDSSAENGHMHTWFPKKKKRNKKERRKRRIETRNAK